MARNYDLFVVTALSSVAAVVALLFPGNEVAVWLALPLVLMLPGYALGAALLPAHNGALEEILLHSLGLSLAIVVLVGLVLNFTVWGLTAVSWAIALTGLTLVGCLVAFLRRPGTRVISVRHTNAGLDLGSALFFALSILTILAAAGVTRLSNAALTTSDLTQLWMLPREAVGFNQYELGVRNAGSTRVTLQLEASVGGTLVYQVSDISLEPGETWERLIQFPPLATGTQVEARLYRQDAPDQVFRHVDIWSNGQ